MEEKSEAVDLSRFHLAEFDRISVVLPKKPQVVEEDVDAQLFEYVASAWRGDEKRMNKLADIDDEWVKDKFPNIGTVEELRRTIKEDLEKNAENSLQEIKIQECSKALVSLVEGDLPEALVDANIEPVRRECLQQLAASGSTLAKYLQRESMTSEQFEEKLRDDVAYRIELNIALDLLVARDGVYVEDDKLTDYLMAEDPKAFLAEVTDRGMLEDARIAACRIKAMRALVEAALVSYEEQ